MPLINGTFIDFQYDLKLSINLNTFIETKNNKRTCLLCNYKASTAYSIVNHIKSTHCAVEIIQSIIEFPKSKRDFILLGEY